MLSKELCEKTLKRVPTISAPGPSGLRGAHLRTLISQSFDLSILAKVLSKIANGKGPDWLRDARLIAIPKANGGARPIAIGEILRRLSATALNEIFLKSEQNHLTNQLAVLNDGALLGAYVIKDRLNSGDSLVMLDTNNAFNSLLRKKQLNSVGNTMLSKYTEWAYRRHSNLHVGEGLVILSQRGVQQGDPLGMTLFCLTMADPLKQVASHHKNVRILSYADDIYVLGSIAYVDRCVLELEEELDVCGLSLNSNKSTVWPILRSDTEPDCSE